MQLTFRRIFWLAIILILTGCTSRQFLPSTEPKSQPTEILPIFSGTQTQTETPSPAQQKTDRARVRTQTAQAKPTRTRTPTPRPLEPSLTPTLTPTRGPLANPLPAPLYYISSAMDSQGGPILQIFRLEPDGITVRQITNEETDVHTFDISQDGTLAYVINNQLILSDSSGSGRQVLAEGADVPLEDSEEKRELWHAQEEIESPVWSPDGQSIAFQQNGVNIINVKSGRKTKVTLVLTDFNNPKYVRGVPRLYPIDWTPDGQRIILKGIEYEQFFTFIVMAHANANPYWVNTPYDFLITSNKDKAHTETQNMAGCCDYSFTNEGKLLFSSGNHYDIGLWLINPTTGRGQNIMSSDEKLLDQFRPRISHPIQASNGQIWFFAKPPDATDPGDSSYTLAWVDESHLPFRFPEDVHYVNQDFRWQGELWQPDGSRVIARYVHDKGPGFWLIDAATGQAIELGVEGEQLHWGPAE